MMLGDVFVSLAKRESIPPHKIDFMKREIEKTNFGKGRFSFGKIFLPQIIEPVYTNTFTANTDEVTVFLPTSYNHIVIYCNGRTTNAANPGASYVLARINSDTGNNYDITGMGGQNTSPSTLTTIGYGYMPVGVISGDGASANESLSSFSVLFHYQGDHYKQCLIFDGRGNIYTALRITRWNNTDRIRTLALSADASQIKAGSVISIYGIK